jgi:hypothetical protein
MGPKGRKNTAALATALALAVAPAAALGKPDPGQQKRNYSLNSVTGEYSPAKNVPVPVPVAHAADSSFQWGDAAAGAGIALLLSGSAIGGGVAIRRRGHSQPA